MSHLPSETSELNVRIEQVLTRLGVLPGHVAVVPLVGGLTNRNFRVELPDGVVVLRIGGAQTDLLGIDRECEHAATAIAASLGVGAEVVLADAQADVLVTRFIAGAALTPERARTPHVLARLAAAVRRVHEGPVFPGHFAPWTSTRQMLAHARSRGIVPHEKMAEALVALAAIEQALGAAVELRPCHNDMLAANFLEDGEHIRIIDWEFAAWATLTSIWATWPSTSDLRPATIPRCCWPTASSRTPARWLDWP